MEFGDATEHVLDESVSHTLAGSTPLYAALAEAGLAKSKSEGRRLIQSGGVKVDGEKANDPEQPLDAFPGADRGAWVVRLGKKHAVRFVRGTKTPT